MSRLSRAGLLVFFGLSACTTAEEPAGSEGLALGSPPSAPERFSFGSPASAEGVAAWSVNVFPDGRGLPPGQGTVAEGAAVFARSCAACHGATGVEGPNNVLVGTAPWEDYPGTRAIGGYWPYSTTLFDYIRRAMPQMAPGSLTDNETYAVIAWILHRNELVPDDAVMNATALPAVLMPARDRFIPDDRLQGGTQIR
jgi:S-disulfanyl-L-cysteine oxidoreductase SoxD